MKCMKTLRNLITALSIGLASAGFVKGLENKVKAEPLIAKWPEISTIRDNGIVAGLEVETEGGANIYWNDGRYHDESELPYASLSIDKKCLIINSDDRRISVKLPQGWNYGGLEDKFGNIGISARNAEVTVQDRSKWNLVPLITVIGDRNYDASIFVYDNFSVSVYDDKGEPKALLATCGLEEKKSPSFQLKISNERTDVPIGWKDYFVDNYRRLTKANRGLIRENNNEQPSVFFHVEKNGEGETNWRDINLYLPSKAFAKVKDKEKFWMRTIYDEQLRLRNASYKELQKYTCPITEFERRIIQEHWERVLSEKKRLEEAYHRKTGKIAIVDPVGFFMSEEEILKEYYKKHKIR